MRAKIETKLVSYCI